MLTDYFIASPAELQTLRIQTTPADRFPAVRAKSADTVKLAALQRILATAGSDPVLAVLKCRVVGEPTSQGPWLFAVPAVLTDVLARLTESEVAQVAGQWADTQEWRLDRGSRELIASVLGELHALAQNARSTDREMFLWMSL